MPSAVPPLRVSRPIAACGPCRKAKSKCDQKLPVCTSCEKSNKADQCLSSAADTRETSYVATLEAQKASLDRRMAELRSRKNSLASFPPSRRVSEAETKNEPEHLPARRTRMNAAKREATNVDDLVGDFGLLSISATSRDFYGFTSETSYAKLALVAAENAPLPARSPHEQQLPPRETTACLMDAYIEHTWRHLPIVDETTMWTSFNNIYASNCPTAFDHFLVRITLAISLATGPSQDAAQACHDAVTHLERAVACAPSILRPGSVGSMQALLLLAVYSMIDPTYLDWWMLLGSASRAMVDIGMHHDPPKSANMPRSELDLRRRVFWCVYSLDRIAAMVSGRDLSIEEASVHVKFPAAASTPAAALAIFRLRQLQSQIVSALRDSTGIPADWDAEQYIWHLYRKLGEWIKASSPSFDADTARVLAAEYEFSCCFLVYRSPRLSLPEVEDQARVLREKHANRYFELLGACQIRPLFVHAMGSRRLWDILGGT